MTELPFPESPTHKLIGMIATVAREISMRKRVYPKWVAAGKMSQQHADAEIADMEGVLAYLQAAKTANDAR